MTNPEDRISPTDWRAEFQKEFGCECDSNFCHRLQTERMIEAFIENLLASQATQYENRMKEVVEQIKDEKKEIGYESEQEEPDIIDETWADMYDTKAEAWFAGWDKAIDKAVSLLQSNPE